MTHCRFSCEKFRSFAIDGSATLTIETSRIVMKNAVATTARIRQRCGSEDMRKTYVIAPGLCFAIPAEGWGQTPSGSDPV